jgi:DNA-binding IclR family transcriptional regulator
MSAQVPAVRRATALLRLLASRPGPLPAATVARELGLPRSTVYHLLTALAEDGFVVHLPDERRWGLGVAAFEIGSAYLRHDPLERLAEPVLSRLADDQNETVHLGILHGRETLYLLKRQPVKPVTLVTAVGVRLPAQLTAVGRAMLGELPSAQVRALFPATDAFVDRTGAGPRSLPELRRWIAADRRRGWAEEDGLVTPGIASVAAPVFDHNGRPIAAVGITFRAEAHDVPARGRLAAAARAAAARITRQLAPRSHA